MNRYRIFVAWTILFCSLGLFIGCSHTLTLTPQSPPKTYQRVNRFGADNRAKLKMMAGNLFFGQGVEVASDTVRLGYIEPDVADAMRKSGFLLPPRQTAVFPTMDVDWIRMRSPMRGSFEGLLFGLAAGVLASAILVEPVWERGPNAPDDVWIAVMVPTISGILIGSLIGSPYTVRFAR